MIRHFLDRFGLGAEWVGGLIIFLFGVRVVLVPSSLNPLAYADLRELAPAFIWGWFSIIVGAVRLWLLAMNGRIRYGAHARSGIAFLATFFWFLIAVGWALNGTATALPVYAGLFLSEAIIMITAAREAARMDLAANGSG